MRCVVAGSGIAGMTAALLLARQGHAVTLLEAGPRVAPLLRGFWREGLHFDTGFHYAGGLHKGGVLRRWLAALGVEKSLNFIEGYEDHIHFADGTNYLLPAGEELAPRMEQYFPGHGAALRTVQQECKASLHHSPYTNAALHGEPSMRWGSGHSVAQRLESLNMPPHMAELLALRCLLYGAPPARASWDEYALVTGPYFQSSGSWQGGGDTLTQALEAELRAAGVDIRCRALLTGMDTGTDTGTGGGKSARATRPAPPQAGLRAVRLADGTILPCDQCFFTGHPRQLTHILPKGTLRPSFMNHLLELPETGYPLMIFAETQALPPGRNSFFLPAPAHGDAGFGNEKGFSVGQNLFSTMDSPCPSLYLACGHPATAESAQDSGEAGRVPLLAMAFVRPEFLPDEHASAAVRRQYKVHAVEQLAALVEARCPELHHGRARKVWRILDAATAHTMRRWIHGSTGSLYGVLHDRENMPLLPVTRVPGLFLAGQNILLPGVLGGIVSAALAVGFAHGHDAALRDFRNTEAQTAPQPITVFEDSRS